MKQTEDSINNSFNKLVGIFNGLSNEDKAQLLMDCSISITEVLDLDIGDQLLFKEMSTLIFNGKKKRWKTSYVILTINSYESKDLRRVVGRLTTFAKKHSFQLEEINAGEDFSDTYAEISIGMRNKWCEYKLIFENFFEEDKLLEFLNQFPEIKIGKKQQFT